MITSADVNSFMQKKAEHITIPFPSGSMTGAGIGGVLGALAGIYANKLNPGVSKIDSR